ncbi:hypothetical protein DV736_g4532, partial [Chaetothyriales sp. CBS 134916]
MTTTIHAGRKWQAPNQSPDGPNTASRRVTQPHMRETLTLVKMLSQYNPVYDRLAWLSLQTALVLSQTCRQLRRAYLERWRVDGRLRRFVQNPQHLRSELGKYASLISGSFALQFFAQEQWPESDLDIFVEQGPAMESLERHLQEDEHYCLISTADHSEYAMRTLVQIRTYHRPSAVDPERAKVQLIVTSQMPILGILGGFYTTAVLNVISWNKAYALFARDTFLDRTTYMLKPLDTYFETLLRKYKRRGWSWAEIMRPEDYSPRTSIQPNRRLGDRHTWTISLPTEGVEKAPQPDLVLEYSCFMLQPRRTRSNPTTLSYLLSAEPFQHLSLNYRYVRAGRLTWIGFLAERLHSYAKLDILAMEPKDRPKWVRRDERFHYNIMDDFYHNSDVLTQFQKPKDWRTFDSEIPRWYKQWYSSLSPQALEFPAELEDQSDF